MIRLETIDKTYQMGKDVFVAALRKVSLHITTGEFVAVMGPSGSGKSTLMQIIGCLDRPTGGRYFLDGAEVSKKKDDQLAEIRNKHVGFVFQRFDLLPRLTALENVELPLIYRGLPPPQRRRQAAEALEAVGLADRLRHRPTELSGGQQQRVAIARALAAEPSLVLADEPTGSLDSRAGAEIMEMFQKLNREGITVILVTHDEETAGAARRIIRLRDGMVVSDEVRGKEQYRETAPFREVTF